jgi:hypothetical protein
MEPTAAEVRAQARGELAAAHFATKAEARPAAVDCPQNHGLQLFTTEKSFGCDVCHERFQKGRVMRGCRACDYDVCTACASAAEDVDNTAQSHARLPRSQASYDELLAAARERAKQRKVELDLLAKRHQEAAERAAAEKVERDKRP